MFSKQGPPTAESIKASADRITGHFAVENVLERLGIAKPTYFYHCGVTKRGKMEIMGPEDASEAEEHAKNLTDAVTGDEGGRVFELSTRDLSRATQEIKASMIQDGVDHDKALSRASHKVTEEVKDRSKDSVLQRAFRKIGRR